MQLLRTAAVAALLAALAVPFAVSQEADAASWQLLAVDERGLPVPDVALEFVDTAPGAVRAASLDGARRTDGDGLIRGQGEAPYVLDVVSRDPRWAVAFLHGARVADESLPEDLLGERLHRLDFDSPVVSVLHRTGSIRVWVEGANATDRFHVAFTDERPEPASHRRGLAATSFDGEKGELFAAPGRGTLYVARDGALGSPVLANGRPLLVSVESGVTCDIVVRFVDGPTTTLLAPFDTIPFDRLEALTPDGSIVVADLPFESSPLRVPSALPIAAGTPYDPKMPMGVRLPKHLLRAADVPVQQPLSTRPDDAADSPRPRVDRAPVVLTFPVDVGGKVRFPEVEAGWLQLAGEGIMVLGGSTGTAARAAKLRNDPGFARLGALLGPPRPGRPGAPPWSGTALVQHADGRPAAFREVLVAAHGMPPMRALTNEAGELEVLGAVADEVTVASLTCVTDRVTLRRASDEPVIGTLTVADRTRVVSGDWTANDEERSPVVGGVLSLVPADPDEGEARRGFGTRAYALAITDAAGNFWFQDVPVGDYLLYSDRATKHRVTVGPDADVKLGLVGKGGDEEVRIHVGG